MKRIALLLLALPLCAGADDTVLPTPAKPKPKAVAKPAAKPTEPRPLCVWSPTDTDPCGCYYERPGWPEDKGPKWAWRECEAPAARLAEPSIIPEPPPQPLCLWDPIEQASAPSPTCDCYFQAEPAGSWVFRACEAPPPLEPSVPQPGLRLGLQAWSLAGFSGEADERFTYGGRILADGPVANPWDKPVRMFLRLDLTQVPGRSFSVADVETFGQAAELRGGAYWTLAQRPHFDAVGTLDQHITTSVVSWSGFSTMIDDEVEARVGDRYLRSFGLGLRLAEEISGAELLLTYCREEAAGYIGLGQICVGGSVPIMGANGAVVIGGNAVLNLSDATVSDQRDIFRVWIGVDPGKLIR